MLRDFINEARQLIKGTEPFAIAMVVNREIPSSSKPGDKMIITNDGKIHGWIGGGCTKGIVVKEALHAIKDGKTRFVSICPNPGSVIPQKGVILYQMTCQSGGKVDVYIEPIMPMPTLHILGKTHIARALASLAKLSGYRVSMIAPNIHDELFTEVDHFIDLSEYDPKQVRADYYLIVCTQGEGDEEALSKALASNAHFISFVASRKKANGIFKDLRAQSITFEQLKRIKTPAGININAKLPYEVGVSILAEIITHFRSEKSSEETINTESTFLEEYYVNPVCQIPIQKTTAKYIIEHKGQKVYFCCDGCKIKFEENPAAYIS